MPSPSANDFVEALYDYTATKPDELSFVTGEILLILRDVPVCNVD